MRADSEKGNLSIEFITFTDVMKRIFCVLISIFLLSVLTDLKEIIKIPTLVNHYHEHASEHHHLAFSEFLHIHYSDHHQHPDDEEEHSFPYKSDTVNSLSMFLVTFLDFETKNSNFEKKILSSMLITNLDFIQSNYFGKIWQPPKIA